MAKASKSKKQSDASSGLKMVGGAAAGAAVGALSGPIGAAVGAVAGGIAGAKAKEILGSKPAQKVAASAKKAAKRVTSTNVRKALAKVTGSKGSKKTPSSKARAKKTNSRRAKAR